jgi:hypothetical protein
VDETVEIEIRGDEAFMRNLGGNPPQWRRFVCNSVMPRNPSGFRFAGVDGRGRQELVRDPRDGGPAVVRIDDPKAGSEGYTFDIFWSGGEGYPTGPGAGYPGGGYPGGGYPGGNRFTREQAVRICQDAIRQQAADRFRSRDVVFRRTEMDEQPGRNDWVVGAISVRRGEGREEAYRFSCSVNFDSGRVRSAQIEDRPDYQDGGGSSNRRAIENCQRAVEQRLLRDGYDQVDFRSINVDGRPGREERIVGDARASGRNRPDAFDFSCSVDFDSGNVRSVDVRRR